MKSVDLTCIQKSTLPQMALSSMFCPNFLACRFPEPISDTLTGFSLSSKSPWSMEAI
jgi:hypothetical protein